MSGGLGGVAERLVRRVVVGIDGRSGSGKSTFADELARTLEPRDNQSSVRGPICSIGPRGAGAVGGVIRRRLLPALPPDRGITDQLLLPFREGAVEVLVSAFDEPSDMPQHRAVAVATSAILIFYGLFVHRSEFLLLRDLSVMLPTLRRGVVAVPRG
jgi:energy-coupling factor transporter ATP-binding protein EcfA2